MPMTRQEAIRRYPRIVAHVICHSLGYATPTLAADIVAKARNRGPQYCEWIYCCYKADPRPAVTDAIRNRHGHRGYMAEYGQAKALVRDALAAGREPIFASWS